MRTFVENQLIFSHTTNMGIVMEVFIFWSGKSYEKVLEFHSHKVMNTVSVKVLTFGFGSTCSLDGCNESEEYTPDQS